MDLLDELQTRPVCGDGAIGTMLLEAGVPIDRCFEELCVTEPERIDTIHRQYIAAGARVIETNSFGANAARLERFGLEHKVSEINRAAAHLAVKAARGKNVYVAGSVGPLGITAEEAQARRIDRAQCFREQISALLEGGAQIIFLETFMDFAEMEIALRAKKEIDDCLEICSFACAPQGQLESGMSFIDALAKLREIGARMMGANCMNGPRAMVQLLQRFPVGDIHAAYPTAGEPEPPTGPLVYPATPDDFAQAARELVAAGARLIGGCCGTKPEHIAAIAAAIADLQPVRAKPVRVLAEPAP
ncbi:MAG: methionine synthase / methylenetetrahydrofolate reductase [Verrucomicrobiota bacterium]